jgi:hypothetical protein
MHALTAAGLNADLRPLGLSFGFDPRLPEEVKQKIRSTVFTHHAEERKGEQTDAQFVYTTRKKAWAALAVELRR